MNRISAWIIALLLAMMAGAGTAAAALRTEVVQYRLGDETFSGYLAWDDAVEGERPGVLVVHEWWGHNPYARRRAEMLAGLGYTAFALDMYGGGRLAEHPDEAKAFMSAVTSNMLPKQPLSCANVVVNDPAAACALNTRANARTRASVTSNSFLRI